MYMTIGGKREDVQGCGRRGRMVRMYSEETIRGRGRTNGNEDAAELAH